MNTARVLALAGPTASGKSAIAMEFALDSAHERAVEIVSVDSAQVYRGMDIGTAKPSAAERAAVPHHLIDLIEPEERYSAARFVHDARQAIGDITRRGGVALLVGGTMLYLKALIEGLDTLPGADAAWRAALDERAAREGWPALHAELARVDPLTAARLAPHDAQRIQRALEVWHVSGEPLSAWHGRGARQAMQVPLVALEPASRAWLHERIAMRFDAMLAAGLVDEVRRLRERPGLQAAMPSMRCVGYRQAWQVLGDNRLDNSSLDGGSLDTLRERGIAATRQLAKRQLTWLRGMVRASVPADAPDASAQARVLLRRLLDAVPG
jgi:tRNA dimethylallyltransferase